MDLNEAKQLLKTAGYRVINEREINLNNLVKDIFEVLTSFGISASDDEVERLMQAYINSGHKPENSNAEDILEFDIDNAPDTIIDYTSDFVDWIKSGQYKTGPVDEAKQILKKAGYLLEFTEGRYCIKNKNTGKYFTGVGATDKCFPWTDDITKAHKNWGDNLWAVMDSIEHICLIEHGLKPSDLIIIDTVTGDEIEYEKPKHPGYWRFD